MQNRYNLSFGLFGGHSLETTIHLAKKMEQASLSACWIFEDYFFGGAFTTATACALQTSTIQIAIGVINPFTRHPVLSAMEAAALDALSKGRLILGMGCSNKRWMEDMAGIPFHKPVPAAMEAAMIIKQLVRDKQVHFQGEVFRTGPVHLEFETYRSQLPVYMGVKGPNALYKAGQFADGVVLSSLTSIPYVKYAKEHIAKGARSQGRNPDDIQIAAYFPTYVATDAKKAKQKVKPYIAKFIGIHGTHPIMLEAGLSEKVIKPFQDALADGKPERAVPLVTDEIVDLLAIAGGPEECRKKLEHILDAGVHMPIAFELPGEDPLQMIDSFYEHLIRG